MSDAGVSFVAQVNAALTTFLDERAESLGQVGPELPTSPSRTPHRARRWQAIAPAVRVLGLALGPRRRRRRARRCRGESRAPALLRPRPDDLMDRSDTRRGHPSAHSAFSALHRTKAWTGDPGVFGAAAPSCSATCCSRGPTRCSRGPASASGARGLRRDAANS